MTWAARHRPVLLEQRVQVVLGGIPDEVTDVNVLRHRKTFPVHQFEPPLPRAAATGPTAPETSPGMGATAAARTASAPPGVTSRPSRPARGAASGGTSSVRPTILPRPCCLPEERPSPRERGGPLPLPGQSTGPVLPTFSGSFGEWQHGKVQRCATHPRRQRLRHRKTHGKGRDFTGTGKQIWFVHLQRTFYPAAPCRMTAIIYPTPAPIPSDFFVNMGSIVGRSAAEGSSPRLLVISVPTLPKITPTMFRFAPFGEN